MNKYPTEPVLLFVFFVSTYSPSHTPQDPNSIPNEAATTGESYTVQDKKPDNELEKKQPEASRLTEEQPAKITSARSL